MMPSVNMLGDFIVLIALLSVLNCVQNLPWLDRWLHGCAFVSLYAFL